MEDLERTELINIEIGILEDDSEFSVYSEIEPSTGLIKLCEELGIEEELKEYIEKISNSIHHGYVEKSTLEILSKSCEVTEREEKETWN